MIGHTWRVAVCELAVGQWGLFTAGQACAIGVPYTRLTEGANRGVIDRITHGVYRVAGAPIHPHESLRAAWLSLDPQRTADDRLKDVDPGGVVSHGSAAWIRELGGLDADIMEFTVPVRRRTRQRDLRLHTGVVPSDAWNHVDGLPVTIALRTIADLAAAGIDGNHLATFVAVARRTEHLTDDDLAHVLEPHSRRYGLPRHDGPARLEHLHATR